MGKKQGSKRLKRTASPKIWNIPRKGKRFVPKPSPGPHSENFGIPLIMILREILKLAKTSREATSAIKTGAVLVDGRVKHDPNLPVGLMDVISIPSIGKIYRIVPSTKTPLDILEIPESEKALKICKIRSKTTASSSTFQFGLHDGRSILTGAEINLKVGDTSLIELPSQKMVKHVGLKVGSLVMITGGRNTGSFGKIKQIKPASISRSAMASIDISGSNLEVPVRMIMAVGDEKPLITLSGAS